MKKLGNKDVPPPAGKVEWTDEARALMSCGERENWQIAYDIYATGMAGIRALENMSVSGDILDPDRNRKGIRGEQGNEWHGGW